MIGFILGCFFGGIAVFVLMCCLQLNKNIEYEEKICDLAGENLNLYTNWKMFEHKYEALEEKHKRLKEIHKEVLHRNMLLVEANCEPDRNCSTDNEKESIDGKEN